MQRQIKYRLTGCLWDASGETPVAFGNPGSPPGPLFPVAPEPSVQVELPQWLDVRRVLGLAQRLGELLLEQVFLVLLRFHRLPEDGLLALILRPHGLRRRLQVLKHALTRRRCVADRKS